MLSSYRVEYIKHSFNILNYKRKEKNVFKNDYIKLNVFYDSFYIQNKKAYVIITNNSCKNNICSYCVLDKRINIYIIRIINFDKNEILKFLSMIEKKHTNLLIIHSFKMSNILLSDEDFFKDNWNHISLTPFDLQYEHNSNTNFYFNFLYGKNNHELKQLKINKQLKNVYIVNLPSNSFFEDPDFKYNNIKIKYTNSDDYLSLESLNIGRKKVNQFI